jgi:hypothetical protein
VAGNKEAEIILTFAELKKRVGAPCFVRLKPKAKQEYMTGVLCDYRNTGACGNKCQVILNHKTQAVDVIDKRVFWGELPKGGKIVEKEVGPHA